MKKVNLQNVKSFLKSKKNLLIIFLIGLVFLLVFYSHLLRKAMISQNETFDVLLNTQKILEEDRNLSECKSIKDIKSYNVEDFSDEYKIELEIFDLYQNNKDNIIGSKRTIYHVIDKKIDREILTVDTLNSKELLKGKDFSDNENMYFDKNDVIGVNGRPYCEPENPIFYQDFNFDGIKDFAFMTGRGSVYRTASFDVYLATKNGFVYNEDFTKLAKHYCGMFEVKENNILTISNNGAYHNFNYEFIVEDNKPINTLKITKDMYFSSVEGAYTEITTEKLVNGVWTKEVTTEPYEK